jgi:ribosomal protein S18 acetylase RimI-like enzyme
MITIEPITPQNVSIFKAARLRALKDTPSAFGSTYAHESQFTEAEWVARANKWNGENSILYLAMDAGQPVGIAGSHIDHDDPTRAHLISMETTRTHRNQGVGRMLVNEVIEWARLRNVRTLHLMVTGSNDAAIAFYQRLGFTFTGHTEPYPNDPAIIEHEMSRPLS